MPVTIVCTYIYWVKPFCYGGEDWFCELWLKQINIYQKSNKDHNAWKSECW